MALQLSHFLNYCIQYLIAKFCKYGDYTVASPWENPKMKKYSYNLHYFHYLCKLFNRDEYDLVTIDSSHYTDYGMFKVANKICEFING